MSAISETITATNRKQNKNVPASIELSHIRFSDQPNKRSEWNFDLSLRRNQNHILKYI